VLTRSYGFDAVGNILSRQDRFGATAYAYDPLYLLTGADHPGAAGLADEAFSYDRVGNRLTSAEASGTWSYNQNNELQSSATTTYEYDANGRGVSSPKIKK
jgi:YD repeat-containing protein